MYAHRLTVFQKHVWLLVLIPGLLSLPWGKASAQGQTTSFKGAEVWPGRIIVWYDQPGEAAGKSGLLQRHLSGLQSTFSVQTVEPLSRDGRLEVWEMQGDVEAALEQLNALPGLRATPDFVIRLPEVRHRPFTASGGQVQDGIRVEPTEQAGLPFALRPAAPADRSKPETAQRADDAEALRTRIQEALRTVDRPAVLPSAAGQAADEETIVYADSLNDSTAVAAKWSVFKFGPPESNEWTLVDPASTGDFFFLVGDLDSTYTDNTYTVAISPLIDLSALGTDRAYYLTFDFAAALELCCDHFQLEVYQDGLSFSSFNLSREDGQLQKARIDITGLAGRSNVEFHFVMISDGSITPGFGVLFDNVAILEAEPPPPPPTSDPLLPFQWALHNDGTFVDFVDGTPAVEDADIDAFEAWEHATPYAVTPEGDTLALVVFDTGVDLDHPDLRSNLWVNRGEIPGNGIDDDRNGYVDDVYGYDAVEQHGHPDDWHGHGTHVAGILGAVGNNGIGISGVAQRVKIIPVRVLGGDGFGFFSSALRGLDYISALLEQGVPVVASNHSWGIAFSFVQELAHWRFIMEQFALEHYRRGHIWVAAAGNAGFQDDSPFFDVPDLLQAPNLISVAATNVGDALAFFSDYGKRTVEIAAPGQDILSTFPVELGEYAYSTGTSMAAPHIAGALALARARYPDEDVSALLARMMATTDAGVGPVSLEDFVMAEGRLNLHHALVPAATGEAGLLPGPPAALFSKTVLDEAGRLSVGFANATGGEVTVMDVTFSGTDADAFALSTPEIIPPGEGAATRAAAQDTPLPVGGAYGVPVEFRPDGSKEIFEAALTFSTSAGNLTIPLNGRDMPFATIMLEPAADDRGFVPLGDTIRSTFTLSNNGTGALEYEIAQTLLARNEEATARLQALAPQRAAPGRPERTPAPDQPSLRQLGRVTHAFIRAAYPDMKRPSVQLKRAAPEERTYLTGSRFSLSDVDLEVFWSDSLNDPEAVAENWEVIDVNEIVNGVPSTELWELEDASAISGLPGDYAFVAGHLGGTYQPDAWTGVWSPAFDFTALAESGEAPYYLRLDFGAHVDGYPWDFFYLNIIVDGDYYKTVAITGDVWDGPQPLPNDGSVHEVLIDITDLTGRRNVEFLFLFTSDCCYEAGFGVLFDNPAILKAPAPYFASKYDGTVPPGGSDEVAVEVRTGLLEQGAYLLITDVFSNALFFETPPFHLLFFETSLVGAKVTPPVAFIEEPVYRGEQVSSTFTIENIGVVPAEFEVIPSLVSIFEPPPPGDTVEVSRHRTAAFTAAARTRLEGVQKTTPKKAPAERPDLRVQIQRMMRTLRLPAASSGKQAAARRPAPAFASRVLAAQPDVLYFEDFEGSSDFPEGWTIEDNRLGLATEWEIVNIGSEAHPNNVAFFGNPETLTYENLSETYAISPFVDLSGVGDAQNVFFEFDYAAFLEPGFDFFAVFVGVADEQGFETLTPLGSSEDRLSGTGTAVFDLSFLHGRSQVFFVFAATSDITVNAGFAYFDNVAVYADEATLYATPRQGELAVGETEEVTLVVNTENLLPSPYPYAAVANVLLFNPDELASHTASHVLIFSVLNRAPVAARDTLGVLSGETYDLSVLLTAALSNDSDADGDSIFVLDTTDPVYGDLKRTSFEQVQYVAPRDFDGYDRFLYVISDGFDTDTASVILAVRAQPQFVTGSQQQYAFIEGESLTLNTIRLAAGVGGLDERVAVWGATEEPNLGITWDFSAHTITFSAAEHWYGQAAATLYVGYEDDMDEPVDAIDVTIVVTPLDNILVVIAVEAQGLTVSFRAGTPQHPAHPITAWHWTFGDGHTSTDRNPVHEYGAAGTYTVGLTVTGARGATGRAELQLELTTPVGTEAEPHELPGTFVLFQNYPNPFNPSTTIRFGLPTPERVTLRVYNTLGQVVQELYSNQSLPAGYHTVSFDGAGLASGLYVYQLEISGENHRVLPSQKMVLLK